MMEHYPEATYEYHEGKKFDDGTVEVSVTITIGETSRMATLPVMDYKNKAIISPDARQINDNKQRSFVKAIANIKCPTKIPIKSKREISLVKLVILKYSTIFYLY